MEFTVSLFAPLRAIRQWKGESAQHDINARSADFALFEVCGFFSGIDGQAASRKAGQKRETLRYPLCSF